MVALGAGILFLCSKSLLETSQDAKINQIFIPAMHQFYRERSDQVSQAPARGHSMKPFIMSKFVLWLGTIPSIPAGMLILYFLKAIFFNFLRGTTNPDDAVSHGWVMFQLDLLTAPQGPHAHVHVDLVLCMLSGFLRRFHAGQTGGVEASGTI